MHREKYIRLRNNNNLEEIVYSFYVLECEKRGVKVLEPSIFFYIFSLWYYKNEVVERILNYYDTKYILTTVISVKGRNILYL